MPLAPDKSDNRRAAALEWQEIGGVGSGCTGTESLGSHFPLAFASAAGRGRFRDSQLHFGGRITVPSFVSHLYQKP